MQWYVLILKSNYEKQAEQIIHSLRVGVSYYCCNNKELFDVR
jgi:hypothetical protein